MTEILQIEPIGVIETPFEEAEGAPIQSSRSAGATGTIRLDPRFREGLDDLEGFERIWLIYWFHKAPEPRLKVTPFLDQEERGIFATRAPARPCPIGMSAVRLLAIHGSILEVADVDMLNGTPLLDIKPYVPEFDCHPQSRAGWLDRSRSERSLADGRFSPLSPAADSEGT